MAKDMLIGTVAEKAGLNPRTIRYYEQVGVLPKPRRRQTGYASAGYRLYSDRDVERLRLIKGARLLGLSLPEIRELLHSLDGGGRKHLQSLLRENLAALDGKIEDLQLLRDQFVRILDVIAHGNAENETPCCDPLCGPEVCPPLVSIETPRDTSGEERRQTSSSRR